MTKAKRNEEIRQMIRKGTNSQVVADMFELSRSRVNHIASHTTRQITPARCRYKGLREWLNANHCTVSEFRLMLQEATTYPIHHETLRRALRGECMKKQLIDAIIAVTGLSYEKLFGEEG